MSSSSNNYIPRPDGDFSAWANHAYPALDAWYATQGLSTDELTPLKDALDAWNQVYPAHVAAQAAAQAARAAKVAARLDVERTARGVIAFVQAFPTTTNADRATIGISPRVAQRGSLPAPASRPVVLADAGQRLTHTLRLVDDGSPTKRARPRGVERAEVFVALTPPATPAPAESHAYRYVQSVSDGSMTLSFEASQGGMQAHYMARWVTRRGAIGAWSDTASATVAA
jgi:hypothetical protein